MAYSHAIGVVHRDLKPANLIFDRTGNLLVSDFGLALFVDDDPLRSRITDSGDIIGTPFYMSPEQARGMPSWHGPPCDIYSLGVILYESITGEKPFTGNRDQVRDAIKKGNPRKPQSINSQVDLELQKICLKAMSLLITERFSTMQEFANALGTYLKRQERTFGADLLVSAGPDRPSVYFSGRRRIEMAKIDPSVFVMGSYANDAEGPPGEVRIAVPYLIAVHQVTQSLYEAITGSLPLSAFRGERDRPVDSVSWYDAVQFCNLLSVSDGFTPYYAIEPGGRVSRGNGTGYRLPTEAEWECACRAGCTAKYCYGDDAARLEEFAWYERNSGDQTHAVGALMPNAFGLHDVHGNVWEWCWDWYAPYRKSRRGRGSTVDDPRGPEAGDERVLRGGCWKADSHSLRSAFRNSYCPTEPLLYFGFRLARSFPP
jgi:formylglycine-generating enzyme required for sulfatase activity